MLLYNVNYSQPHKHFIDFELIIEEVQQDFVELQLAAWRPGRYELQNFAKNIQSFAFFSDTVESEKGVALQGEKISKDRWRVQTKGCKTVSVRYNYYATQMDAGGTFLDTDLFYVNWITCCLYVEGRQAEPYRVRVQMPKNYQVACGMAQKRKANTVIFDAPSFYHLTASPMLASPTLQHYSYQIENLPTTFHIWIQGKWKPNVEKLLADFQAFTAEQVKVFGDFPNESYHFLFLVLPYPYHHGVEHYNSTVLVMGADRDADFNTLKYDDVLAISSHELFHFWNICRIRPAEMLPYDYCKENYFKTGFIAEGITTYYGDYFLARSGVWNFATYKEEIDILLRRHFDNFGRYNHSLLDSSWDLWLDGYTSGIPNRKVSIYVEGALAALVLDLEIRRHTANLHSLDTVMQVFWAKFGKQEKGYQLADYQAIISQVAGVSMDNYFQECIAGKGKIEKWLPNALQFIGCELLVSPSEKLEERYFGFRLVVRDSRLMVGLIEPNSPADEVLALTDEILSIDNQLPTIKNLNELLENKNQIIVQLLHHQKMKTVLLQRNGKEYVNRYTIHKKENPSQAEQENFDKWLVQ
jgi:predicted metalloprotease with PDZ domain